MKSHKNCVISRRILSDIWTQIHNAILGLTVNILCLYDFHFSVISIVRHITSDFGRGLFCAYRHGILMFSGFFVFYFPFVIRKDSSIMTNKLGGGGNFNSSPLYKTN